MSPLYFPNVLRETLWSSRAGGCQLSVRRGFSSPWLISLEGNFKPHPYHDVFIWIQHFRTKTISVHTMRFGSVHTNTPENIYHVTTGHGHAGVNRTQELSQISQIITCLLHMNAIVSLYNAEFNCTTAVSKDNRVSNACNWLSKMSSTLVAEAKASWFLLGGGGGVMWFFFTEKTKSARIIVFSKHLSFCPSRLRSRFKN